ncbi:AAA family ATPase [Gluconacetobacter sacchari]|uniref:AAA family ATPase n=2 Tax=Gluconacetobacter sacchari TaxID=92759 RepID=A0A7W4IAZ4_9PROT|nr:AAA family ATPase [Gluconacetobacter sacchari]MBB2159482.1 AAA family ATPase [Gluconacetobacter sacchari]
MARKAGHTLYRAPFLKRVSLLPERVAEPDAFPFSLPVLTWPSFEIDFTAPVTIFAGPNASGKSTLIEALAALCGFPLHGGNRNFAIGPQGRNALAEALRPSWFPKFTSGFFVRAEGFAALIAEIDRLAAEDPGYAADFLAEFGGRSGTERSHGEGYFHLFSRRIAGRGIYILDEPEAALSPIRQMEFLKIIHAAVQRGDAQFLIATHSPLIMAYPGATVLHLTRHGLVERPFRLTDHFAILSEFHRDPDAFMATLLLG